MCLGLLQCLRIGVGGDEFNAGHAFVDHVLHRIAAGTADANNFNHGAQCCVIEHIDFHDDSLSKVCSFQSLVTARCGD